VDSPRRVLKIPMMDFLRALGFTLDRDEGRIYLPPEMWEHYNLTPEMWPNPEIKVDDGLKGTIAPTRDTTHTMREAQIEIWRKLHPTDPYSDDVLNAINQLSGISVRASVQGDRVVLRDQTGLTNGTLTVADVGAGQLAAQIVRRAHCPVPVRSARGGLRPPS
jgi:hypothetical protein